MEKKQGVSTYFSTLLCAAAKRLLESVARLVAEEHETNLLRLPSSRNGAAHAIRHDARAILHRKAGDASTHRWHCNRAHGMLTRETKHVVHRGSQRLCRRAPAQLHARCMDDVTCTQLTCAGDG